MFYESILQMQFPKHNTRIQSKSACCIKLFEFLSLKNNCQINKNEGNNTFFYANKFRFDMIFKE